MLPVLILAGGFGSRLRSVVKDVPKPLAPVNGKPFLFWVLKNLQRQGCAEVVLSLYHKAELFEEYLRGHTHELKIRCIIEDEPLGTGGAIAYAVYKKAIHGEFLVMNGDTWLDNFFLPMLQTNTPSVGVVSVEDTTRYGSVCWQDNKVVQFLEKQPNAFTGWINAGIYRLSAKDFIGWDCKPFSLESELLPIWVQQERLQVCKLESDFFDIGIPADYLSFTHYIENLKIIRLKNG